VLSVALFVFIIEELISEAFQVTDVSEIKARLLSVLVMWEFEIEE
jgi:hypothetical protein